MTDLFDIPENLSPRLKWQREHCIHVFGPCTPTERWEAVKGGVTGYGDTEDEALIALARKLEIKTWH